MKKQAVCNIVFSVAIAGLLLSNVSLVGKCNTLESNSNKENVTWGGGFG